MSAADLAVTIPVLTSLSIEETARFYRDQLGFSVEAYGDYAIVRRDRMEIHFQLASDRVHPQPASCYIRGGQIVALYDEYRAKGFATLSDFTVQPWNMKEFTLADPHGNVLRFGGAPEELDAH